MTERATLFSDPEGNRLMTAKGSTSNPLVPWLYAAAVGGSLLAALPEGIGARTVACLILDLALLAGFFYCGHRAGLWGGTIRATARVAPGARQKRMRPCRKATS